MIARFVITPSHNPPNSGQADNDVTKWIEGRANGFLASRLRGAK